MILARALAVLLAWPAAAFAQQPPEAQPLPPQAAPGDPAPPPPTPPAAPAAQPVAPPVLEVVQPRSRTWPLTIGIQVMVGGEIQHPRGAPVAFGAAGEFLWRARVGGFAAVMASAGAPVLPVSQGGKVQPSLADRVSIPFGLAARPLSAIAQRRHDWLGRFLNGIDLQVGITVEHLRTSNESQTVAGLHLGLGVELPIVGGAVDGGLSLRLYGRFMATPAVTLEMAATQKVFEPAAVGQIYGGLCYYP